MYKMTKKDFSEIKSNNKHIQTKSKNEKILYAKFTQSCKQKKKKKENKHWNITNIETLQTKKIEWYVKYVEQYSWNILWSS